MKHILIVIAITIVVTLAVGFFLQNVDLMPAVASEEGEVVDFMFYLQMWIIAFLFSLTVHEAAHAWMANQLGDPTARYMGRVSLNAPQDIQGQIGLQTI